jgi:hypothetical protein
LQVSGTNSDGGEFELTVVDAARVVTGAQSLSRPGGLSDQGVKLNADSRGVLVWWPGLPCEDRPTIAVSSNSDTVTIEIDNGPSRGEVCSHNEVQFTVQLTFNKDFARATLGG